MFHSLEHENHRIQQFQDAIQEQQYFGVAEKLVRKAFEKAKDINIYSGKSAYEAIQTSSGVVRYLKIDKRFDNKRRILYELMHEMGHLFDSIPLDRAIAPSSEHQASERSRELRAWKFADEEFNNHPELQDCIQEYTEHKRACLLSYDVVI